MTIPTLDLTRVLPGKVRRQPARFLVGRVREEGPGIVVSLFREPATIEDPEQTARVRAVLGAKPGTCRFPIGEGEAFTYCGAPATRKAGGRMTYCARCAAIMYAPYVRAT